MKTRSIIAILAIFLGISASSCCYGACNREDRAKYIFLFIGDGMGNSHVAVAEYYLSHKAGKLGGEQLTMTTFPCFGTATTHSANKNVTCSSASGTAIACGEKTNNGMVGMNKDSVAIKSMAYELKDDGYRIGIISTVPVNHATPSSFYAHNISRKNTYEISMEIPSSGFDFFAASGFLDIKGKNGDLPATDRYLEENGYNVCYGLGEFNAEVSTADKMVLCQHSAKDRNADNYVSDTEYNQSMGLADMLKAGMQFLGKDEPFFFMCEGGKIDWEAHANNTMPMIEEILDFDDAIKVAYEFYQQHPDETLIVVTADHETGGVALGNGGKDIDWSKNDELKFIKWTTKGHTGGPVPVFAIGKGAEKFNGRMDNTDIKGKIL